jgi:hypothetical protein
MIYALAALTFVMLGYMFWISTFRLRRDRLRLARSSDRSRIIAAPRERLRANLNQAYGLPRQEAEWESRLIANLRAADRG